MFSYLLAKYHVKWNLTLSAAELSLPRGPTLNWAQKKNERVGLERKKERKGDFRLSESTKGMKERDWKEGEKSHGRSHIKTLNSGGDFLTWIRAPFKYFLPKIFYRRHVSQMWYRLKNSWTFSRHLIYDPKTHQRLFLRRRGLTWNRFPGGGKILNLRWGPFMGLKYGGPLNFSLSLFHYYWKDRIWGREGEENRT